MDRFEKWTEVTPADNTQLEDHSAIYIGTGGNLKVRRQASGTVHTFVVPDGALLPIKAYSIESTSTTATNIVLLIDV